MSWHAGTGPAQRGVRRVSAIIPTFNRREPLGRAIASALRQSTAMHELIIIDDGSTDGTWGDLQRLRDSADAVRVIVHRQPNAGQSAARNLGVSLSTGDVIAFLDSDDIWHEEKTARQLAVFEAQPEFDLVGCVTEGMNVFPGRRVVPISVDRLLFRNYFLTPGVMIRRDVLVTIGGFAKDLHRCEDYDLWLRIASAHRCALLNEALIVCGDGKRPYGDSGLSADLWAIQAGELRAFRRWRERGGSLAKYWFAITVSWLRFVRRVALVALEMLRPGRAHIPG